MVLVHVSCFAYIYSVNPSQIKTKRFKILSHAHMQIGYIIILIFPTELQQRVI